MAPRCHIPEQAVPSTHAVAIHRSRLRCGGALRSGRSCCDAVGPMGRWKRGNMPSTLQAVLGEARRNRNLRGTCPRCAVSFRLADALLFSLDSELPREAVAAVAA